MTTLVCPGGQGDVSVYKNLLFMSVEMPNGRLDCGAQGFPPDPPPAAGHAKERHTPSAQKPEEHCRVSVHVAPSVCAATQVPVVLS